LFLDVHVLTVVVCPGTCTRVVVWHPGTRTTKKVIVLTRYYIVTPTLSTQ
jgi:hypothetical protein